MCLSWHSLQVMSSSSSWLLLHFFGPVNDDSTQIHFLGKSSSEFRSCSYCCKCVDKCFTWGFQISLVSRCCQTRYSERGPQQKMTAWLTNNDEYSLKQNIQRCMYLTPKRCWSSKLDEKNEFPLKSRVNRNTWHFKTSQTNVKGETEIKTSTSLNFFWLKATSQKT